MQDFADELDVMPSITMENNVIHNNEGYGVILVKPNTSKGRRSSQSECNIKRDRYVCNTRSMLLFPEDPAADPTAEDKQHGGVPDAPFVSTTNQTPSSSADVQPESAENNSSTDGGVASTSGRKWQFSRQLSRNKETSCSRVVQDLMDHQIFVSIQGNQFRRNGMGDFGNFFY